MQIHTIMSGEKIADVAERYGVSEELIRENNSLENAEPTPGEQLLIITPTRTYSVRRGDTPERLSLRFGVSRRELCANNPSVSLRGLIAGEEIALKCGEPIYGMGVANGYFYKGCPISALKRAMPYLTYVTIAAASEADGEIHTSFDARDARALAVENEKVPLLRIYRAQADVPSGKDAEALCEKIIKTAIDGGYRGVVLSECKGGGCAEFLVELRKKMIGCDLILISEMSEDTELCANEYSDGSVLSYDKYALDNPPSFDEGERRIYSDFACEGESSKSFISLPALAKWGRGYCSIGDALSTARQYGCEIKNDGESLISSFTSQRRGEFSFASLENIKATLDLVSEYGFMGVSFDIMRAPVSHLMMYNSLFRTAYQTSARAAEGCSRGG